MATQVRTCPKCAQLMWLKEDQSTNSWTRKPSVESALNADRRFASSSYHKAKTQPAEDGALNWKGVRR